MSVIALPTVSSKEGKPNDVCAAIHGICHLTATEDSSVTVVISISAVKAAKPIVQFCPENARTMDRSYTVPFPLATKLSTMNS
jgi:hypothetical protein